MGNRGSKERKKNWGRGTDFFKVLKLSEKNILFKKKCFAIRNGKKSLNCQRKQVEIRCKLDENFTQRFNSPPPGTVLLESMAL